ncbi:hypothetical protein DQP56_01050 [Mycolicibacter senuensis]|uniref:Uncharacterized protein n=1 Tax=Mycolicibacter longobardus TaxID=1108812 RepID=A0A1X1YBP4_9MYCO|nr:hypothetical protein AWC16_18815 [Mycolicibacter longobardus]RAV04435.1 hypothetical protein DQP56_01050 [Mycolicibacter senuensis]
MLPQLFSVALMPPGAQVGMAAIAVVFNDAFTVFSADRVHMNRWLLLERGEQLARGACQSR